MSPVTRKASAKPTAKQAAPRASSAAPALAQQAARYQRVALMLQGGGALGSYQVGVYQALAEANCLPSWVCGVSIGAINGALIAGNAPAKRLERLQEFWALIAGRSAGPLAQGGDPFRAWASAASAWMTSNLGQPGFFSPRMVSPWLVPPLTSHAGDPASTSLYDTSPLRATLERLVDFERLNSGETRLSVGAVNVATGNNVFFDTAHQRLGPEHIMASGALPPALPMVQIGKDFFWDGGIVSNTPLQYLLEQEEDVSSLVFQVDLFSAQGAVPKDMGEVSSRQKDITYSSRTRQATSAFKRTLALRRQLADALARVPAKQLRPGEADRMRDYQDAGVVNLVHLIYQAKYFEGDTKDYEFSSEAVALHSKAGYADTAASLARPEWLEPPSADVGLVEHDIHRKN